MDNLKEKTAKGLFWGALNNGTMQVLNLLIGIIVLNRLTPEDTGLIGMLAIFSHCRQPAVEWILHSTHQ